MTMNEGFKSATVILILATSAVFILQLALGRGFTELFLLDSRHVFSRPWILVTHIFLHGSFTHILYNMYGLLLFGPFLEDRIGARRFFLFYILAGIFAGFLSSFFYAKSLGASGALMAVIGALVILMPGLRLLFFYVIPTPLWMAGLLYALIDAAGVLFPSGVGNIAHLAGMGAGLLYGIYLKSEKKRFNRKFSSKRHLGKEDIDEYLKSGRI